MVTVSSAFISSRRERIIFSVLSASCAFKAAAWVDVLRGVLGALGKTDLDNTDVARDNSFHCIAGTESRCPQYSERNCPWPHLYCPSLFYPRLLKPRVKHRPKLRP